MTATEKTTIILLHCQAIKSKSVKQDVKSNASREASPGETNAVQVIIFFYKNMFSFIA